MSDLWKVRHEGSPAHVEVPLLVLQQGLLDGEWELTDEVQGPGERQWSAIEQHPAFEELALDIEEPPASSYDEEGHLDMNALIDVCMVLLIFFILTTSVAAMQKHIEAPTPSDKAIPVPVVTKEKIKETMIYVKVTTVKGEPEIRVEDEIIPLESLYNKLRGMIKGAKSTILLEHDDEATQDVVVQVIDKAKAAKATRISLVVK